MSEIPQRLSQLRRQMLAHDLYAWIAPSSDPHQSEYVATHWQARAWLSGFSGSAGTLVVTHSQAGLWTDARYHLRAAGELAGSGIELFKLGLPGTPRLLEWLREQVPPGAVVGFDGAVMSAAEAANLEAVLAEKGVRVSIQHDLLSEIWLDRPSLPSNPIRIHPDVFAGESRTNKLTRVRSELQRQGGDYHLVCALDDIAWMLNLRGSDIEYNPVAVCYALISQQAARLFIQSEKVPLEVRVELESSGVSLHPYDQIEAHLRNLPEGSAICIDPNKTNARLHRSIPNSCRVIESQSLPYTLKTVKNITELAGIRRAHLRDGAALVRWLCWLEERVRFDAHTGLSLTEITAAEKLDEFRSLEENFQGLSFGTIAGYGPNSAVGHYRTDPANDPILHPTGIFLVDSGAQYLDGTTDITRTISLGNPQPEEKIAFTQVLKCHIRLATAQFPHGATGAQLDAIAREPLWRLGWNCRHGIGHGVGCFLNVHEGPPRFSETSTTALQPGMLLSNEPGVYFEGRFGIRIENVLMVKPPVRSEFGEFLSFETISLAPIDLNLVESTLLEPAEIAWLNAYHCQVRETLSPLLSTAEVDWLEQKTKAL